MKRVTCTVTLLFLFIATNLSADKQWIQIEPIDTNKKQETAQPDINISQIQPLKQWVENAKVVKQLIDSANSIKKQDIENEKKWYILDNTQNSQ